MPKNQYYYIAALYNAMYGDQMKTLSTTYSCVSDPATNPSGIPSLGCMVANSRKYAKDKGYEYVEDSFYIISLIKLTKAQYEQLIDKEEPKMEDSTKTESNEKE